MTGIEIVAALLGLACVAFGVRRSLWTYPYGVGAVLLLSAVFLDARLYSDAGLQLFFAGANLYGWWEWQRSIGATGEVVVDAMRARQRVGWAAAALAAAAAWGWVMQRHTDAAFPFADAAIAAASVAAQLMMARRWWENWVVWIAVDLAAVPLFLARGLWITAGLYAVYLVLAVWGLIDWRRARHAVGPGPL
ncbi:nicotinamide riboside transporter PnuC [Sphingomonas rubra]|uniref:Nicotinamide riboside transporter PnuC n=1 Tax=Sphingomonas rubra TaxID=634430 RepID=A0A1I5QUE4_9SPHN|nr:nicotinamide riboside transporter PnuC [Sphingomonas rubra]SFP49466.1 nicotinamide mononucleotide transporter [Sphingomonas rubra]